jgi:transposase
MSSWRVSTNNMSDKELNNSEVRAEEAASKRHQTIKLGLDVHADMIVVVRILDHSGPQPAQKFSPARFLEWVKIQIGLSEAVHSCYEAGPFGYGLHQGQVLV